MRGAVLQALLTDTAPLCVALCGLLCRAAPPTKAERGVATLLAAWGGRAQQALVAAVSRHAGEDAAAAAGPVAAAALARAEVTVGRQYRYITVTLPLHFRYISVTFPLHYR